MESNKEIIRLKNSGLGYKRIAKQTGISINTIRKIIQRYFGKEGFCRNCGKPLTGKSNQLFCSEHCRYEWTKKNCDLITSTSSCERKCKYCGKVFHSYGVGKRKYCSHDCYINDRFGEAHND